MGSCLCPCCCPKNSIDPNPHHQFAPDENQRHLPTPPERKGQKVVVETEERPEKFKKKKILEPGPEFYFNFDPISKQKDFNKAGELENDRVEENPRRSQEKKVNFEKDKSPGSPPAHNSSGKSSKRRLPALKGSSSKSEKKSGWFTPQYFWKVQYQRFV